MSENQSWREEFRKKFGRFYVSQLGTIDIEGAESIASDDVEYFIESQIAAAEARCEERVRKECVEAHFNSVPNDVDLEIEVGNLVSDFHRFMEAGLVAQAGMAMVYISRVLSREKKNNEARGREEMRELIFSKIPKEVGGDGELSEYKRGHDDAVIEFRAAFKGL